MNTRRQRRLTGASTIIVLAAAAARLSSAPATGADHPAESRRLRAEGLQAGYNLDHETALEVIGELQRRYPRNRLLWLEAASSSLRAGRAPAARSSLEQGLAKLAADPRPRAFGEEARWRYARGATLVALGDTEEAARELRAVLAGEAHGWLRGRARAELGKIADLAGHRLGAADEYRAAMRIARAENDQVGYDAAAALLRAGYRRPERGR